jgi:hypothetical protein
MVSRFFREFASSINAGAVPSTLFDFEKESSEKRTYRARNLMRLLNRARYFKQLGYCWRILQWDTFKLSHFFVATMLQKLANFMTNLWQDLRYSARMLLRTVGKSMLFGLSARDPATYGAVALLLAIVGLMACWIPARREAKVNPMVALRCE